MSSNIVLPQTSLCSIVRDEKINPAGGIQRFVESHVPFVEEAVIVDTGSLDGTREILEEMQSTFPNLRIYNHKFNGFADARNYSLSKVKTKYSLILDADELLCQEKPQNDWENIYSFMQQHPNKNIFNFQFETTSTGELAIKNSCLGSRLFSNNMNNHFSQILWEYLVGDTNNQIDTPIRIKHFLSNK